MKTILLLMISALALSAQVTTADCKIYMDSRGVTRSTCGPHEPIGNMIEIKEHSVQPPVNPSDLCGHKNKLFRVRCLGQDITVQFREFYVPTVHIVNVFSVGIDKPIVTVSEPWQTSLKLSIAQTIGIERIEVQRLQWAEEEGTK
jgi:hypothetical protein